jgi:SAM-dependent methyltransferase
MTIKTQQSIGGKMLKILTAFVLKLPEKFIFRSLMRQLYLEKVLSSRIVEYPLIFKYLNIPEGSRILDVGCCYSLLSIQLSSIGYLVYGIDIEEYPYSHRNFKFFRQDIRKTSFPDDFFDAIIALSTIEHVGLGFSFATLKLTQKSEKDFEGDKKSIKEMTRILRPGGKMLITAPFGKYRITPSERVYDEHHLMNLIEGLNVDHVEYFARRNGDWIPVPFKYANSSEKEAIVFVVVSKPDVSEDSVSGGRA